MKKTKKGKNIAVVLAAGTGSRMKSDVAKQFMMLADKPLICYALQTMENSSLIGDVFLVTGEDDMERMRVDIVVKYGFQKVRAIIPGGSERCYSVANAMSWLSSIAEEDANSGDIVLIHDGARPFVTEEILERTIAAVKEHGACVAAMPSKDTVKIVDEEGFAVTTPDRKTVWAVQTPQVFQKELIVDAYRKFRNDEDKSFATDDASIVERYSDCKVKMIEGAYTNMKVTTPEDMVIAEALLKIKKS